MHFLHINMFFFYLIYIIFLLRRTRWASDALKDFRGRFSVFVPFCRKCLPFNFQFLSKMLVMCFFFWSKKLSCILIDFSTWTLHILSWPLTLTIMNCYTVWDLYSCIALFGFALRPFRYYRSRSRNPATFNMEHFPTLVSSFWVLTFVTSSILVVGGFLHCCWLNG